ncbi:hypothetical protein AA313_de0202904 [Arthrobotrys entomopaga]|nr:hypothetical protein AA313_de0202904 [Arthrobotrys entomopaga]
MEDLEKARTKNALDDKSVEVTEKLTKELDEARITIGHLEDSVKQEKDEKESKLRELEKIAKDLNIRDEQLGLAASRWADASVKLARLETEVAATRADAQSRAEEAQTQRLQAEHHKSKVTALETDLTTKSKLLESFESKLAIAHAESKDWKERFEAQDARSREQQKSFEDEHQEKDAKIFELQDLLCAFKHKITNLETKLINQERMIKEDRLKDIKILALEIELSKLGIITGHFPEQKATEASPDLFTPQEAHREEDTTEETESALEIVPAKSQESIIEREAAIEPSDQTVGADPAVISSGAESNTEQPSSGEANQSQESTDPDPKPSSSSKKKKKKDKIVEEKAGEEEDNEGETNESTNFKNEVSSAPKDKKQKAKDTKGKGKEGKPKEIDFEAIRAMAKEAKAREIKLQEKQLRAWRAQMLEAKEAKFKHLEALRLEAKRAEEKKAEVKEVKSKETNPEETDPEETNPEETNPEETNPDKAGPKETRLKQTTLEKNEPKEMNSQEAQPTETLRRSKRLTAQQKIPYPLIAKHLLKPDHTEEEYEIIADEVKKHRERAYYKYDFTTADPADKMDTRPDHGFPENQDSQSSFVPATQYDNATGPQITHVSTTGSLSQQAGLHEEGLGRSTKKVHFADDAEQVEPSSSSPQQVLLYNAAKQRASPRVLGKLKHLLEEERDDYDMDGDEQDDAESSPKRVRTHGPGDVRQKTWWKKKNGSGKPKLTLKKP